MSFAFPRRLLAIRPVRHWLFAVAACVAFVFALTTRASAATIYVRSDAAAGGNGQSWTTAYNNLQTALAQADGATPTEIWIKTGVYKPTANSDRSVAFVAKSHLIIRGGFAGTENTIAQRPVAASATSFTVLSGDIGVAQPDAITATTNVNDHAARVFDLSAAGAKDNSYNVIRAVSVTGFYLDRVVVAGGYADTDAVPYADIETSLYPTNATGAGFRQTLDSRVNGAAIFAQASSLALLDSWFVGNYAKGIGGAIVARGGTLQLEDNRFIRNITSFGGGGLCVQGVGLVAFNRNLFYANISAYLGGAALIQGDTANENVKAYESVLLSGIAALTSGNPTLAPPPPAAGTVSDIEQAIATVRFLHKNSVKVAKAFQKAAEKTTKFLSSNPSSLSFSAVGSGLSATYAWVSLGVTAIDVGVEIAIFLGADPNDPFIQGWKVFSNGFATYATPTGLAKLAYNALYEFLVPGPGFAQRATELRNKEYDANHNQAAAFVAFDNRFELNHADAYGGAVAVLVQNLVFDRTRFIENSADYGGGAGAFFAYNSVDLENSALVGNTSKLGHSALALGFRTVNRIINTTVVENHSDVASGFAIGVDSGADATVANSILWGNTNGDTNSSANPNRLGGADLFAARKADLDPAGLKAYNDAGDSHGMFTGVLDLQYSVVQSLDRLALGTELFHTLNTPENFSSLRRGGLLVVGHNPNVGEGIASVAGRGNISRDPILLVDIYPHPNSPAINAGSRDVYTRGGTQDIDRNSRSRETAGIIDIGAAEGNGTLASGTILYVNPAVSASGDGLSWATAFQTLPEALAQPLAPGGQIWVAGNATYPATGPMILAPGCSLVGGFAPGASSLAESDPVARPTIISGANGATVLLSGLAKIPDIAAYRRMLGLPRIIRGITFQSANTATDAVRLSIPVVVQSCVFKNNTGSRALSITDPNNFYTRSAGQIIDSTFEANLAGAITCPDTNLEVIRSRFYDNVAPAGAAIHKGNTHDTQWLLLERNVFYNNTATAGRGGAVFLHGQDLVAAHNVFADNFAQPASGDTALVGGAGLFWTAPDQFVSRFRLVNNILYGNRLLGALAASTPLEFQQFALPDLSDYGRSVLNANAVITGNCIEGLNTIAPRGGSAGNVDYDPFFVAPASRDFSLAADSLLVNRGSDYTSGTDSPTTINGVRDIGAAEGSDTTVRPTANIALTVNKPTDTARTFTLQITNPVAGAGNYTWEVLRPGALGMTTVVNDAHHSGVGGGVLVITNPPHTWNGSRYRLRYNNPVRVFSNDVVLNAPPSILYVSPGGTGDGSSWATPFGDVWSAIFIAQPYTQIWLRSGTHLMVNGHPQRLNDLLSASPGIRIYGGFAGGETTRAQRLSSTPPTLLDFGNGGQGYKLTIRNTASWPSDGSPIPTVFDGVTFTGPTTLPNKFCVDLIGADTVFDQVKFTDLAAAAVVVRSGQATFTGVESLRCAGTPITADNATITVANSSFTESGAFDYQTYSSALTLANSTGVITDSRFTANPRRPVVATGSGTLTIERSRFLDNRDGALHLAQSGASRVANSLFARNRTPGDGGAIVNAASGPVTLMHLTLVANSARTGGAVINNGASLTLANSIVWDNSATTAPAIYGTYTRVSSHVQGQVDYAPFFNPNPTVDDYRLAGYSPLVNRGSASVATGATDLLGATRVIGSIPDLGAVESTGSPSSNVYFTTAPAHRVVYEDRPVSYVIAGGIGSTTTATVFTWEYLDDNNVVHPIANLSGWTVVRDGLTTTLSHPSVPLALNGLRLRLLADGIGLIANLRLDVLPRKVLRVDHDVSASGNGSTWASAYATISAALAAADGDTDLWIAGGDYPETALTATEGTRLYVGFAGGETTMSARDAVANPVRLVGAASHITLVPTASHALPEFAFHITAAPTAVTRYVERPIVFSARGDGSASLGWEYLSGANWLPISNLSGWTTTQIGETSTLSYSAAVISQNGLQVRAITPGTQEASFTTTLTVKPRVILYVKPTGTTAPFNGTSWAHAFQTIAAALAVADDGSDIWIAGGTYNDRTLAYVPGANLYAGFAGNETDVNARDIVANPVRLAGTGSYFDFTAAGVNSFRYTLASAPRIRALYFNQPGSLSIGLTGSGAPIEWQYLSGATWLPINGFEGWIVTTTSLGSKLVNPSLPPAHNGLQVRVVVPSIGEISNTVTLSVQARTTYYVKPTGTTAPFNGSSWAHAFPTLTAALAVADDGSDIRVAQGTYDETVHVVPSGARIYGGFAGLDTETLEQRDPVAHPVILRNSTGASVFTIDLSAAEFDLLTLVDGVTIRDGTAAHPAVYLKGSSIAFDSVNFLQSSRAVFLEGNTTQAEFNDCVFLNNTQAVVAATGPTVVIDGGTFSTNHQALTFAAGASLAVTASDFDHSDDYAISAAPGLSVGDCTFSDNARDVVITGDGTATSQIDDTTFAHTTVCAVTSATAVEIVDSTFTATALGLDLTGAATTSKLTRCAFTGGTGTDAVHAPAGLTVADSTFTANARGLVLAASGSDVSRITGGSFTNHTVAGLQSAGPVQLVGVAFTGNVTGLALTGGADVSSVATGTFAGNTTGIASVSGLTVTGGTFTGGGTGIAFAGGTLGSFVKDTTFTGATVAGIDSATRLATDTVTFDNCALGVSLTGGTGISRLVATTFQNSVAGLDVATPARAELLDPVFTGNSGVSLAATGVQILLGNVVQPNVLVVQGTFTENTGPAFVGASGYHKFERSTFVDNTTAGPLLSSTGASLGIANSLVAHNTAADSAILRATGSGSLSLTTSTVADNETGTFVGAVAGTAYVTQSILWGNRASAASARIESMQATSILEITKSIIESLQTTYTWRLPSEQNAAFDPLFTDARAGDYTLQPYSPAIDFGGATFANNLLDLPGSPRVQFGGVDLGAYESASARAATPVQLTFPASGPRTIVNGDTATYAVNFATGDGRSIRWQVDTGSGFVDLVADAYHSFNYANGVLRLVVAGDFALSGHRYRAVISNGSTDIYISPVSTFTVVSRPTFYVDASATGAATGADWTNAFPSLSSALAAAPAFSDIRVAAGTYRAPAGDSFQLRRRQRLLGGYLAGTDTRDSLAHASILSSAVGAPADSIILRGNADQGVVDDLTTVDGFTFTSGGYGIVLNSASPVVRDCRFENLGTGINVVFGRMLIEDCVFTGHTRSAIIARGGDSDLTVVGCVFTDNAGGSGSNAGAGAIALGEPGVATPGTQNAWISDSIFTGNSGVRGGAISSTKTGSFVSIAHCEFRDNTATDRGGAIYTNSNVTLNIRASLLAENQAASDSAVSSFGQATLVFCTVAGNHATTSNGFSIASENGLVLRDCILWANTSAGASASRDDVIHRATRSGAAHFSDSIIEGLQLTPGDRLLPFDPKFVNAAAGDYRLAADSPAIGLGRAADLLSGETDLDGAARPSGSSADLGAYETAATPAPVYAFGLPATLTPPVGTGFTLTQSAPAGFTGAWEYFDGSVWRAINLIGQPGTGPAGAYSYTTFDQNSRRYTVSFSLIDNPLNGVLLRFRLTYQGTDYISAPVAITVPGFDIIYVDQSVSASGAGATWATAYKTLGEALAAVNSTRRVIHVAEGVYRGPFALPMRFEIYGGFPAGGSSLAARDFSAHATILTGLPAVEGDPRASSVVNFKYSGAGYTQPVLDGFTIEDGQTGLLADASVAPTLRHLLVRGHTATGLVLQSANALVQDSVFENNSGFNGGALRASASATLERVVLRGNTATNGGAVYATGHVTFRNVLATGNVAATGGGLWMNNGAVLEQTTLAGNRADAHPALYANFGVATLRNSIVWGNRTTAGAAAPQLAASASVSPSTFSFDHTIVEQASVASGALRFDPLFTAPVAASSAPSVSGDYTLRALSPAIDAGSDALAAGQTLDVDRAPRFVGTIDLGAHESATLSTAPFALTAQSASFVFDRENSTNNVFSVTASNAASYLWQYAAPGSSDWTSLDGVAGFSGATSATLAVTEGNVALNGYRFRVLLTGADGSVVTGGERILTVYAPHLHVNAARPGSEPGDGLSWATAFKTLGEALAAIPAFPDSAEIWIAAGAYAPTAPATTFTVRAGVSLYGGFAATETARDQRDPSVNVSALVAPSGGSASIVTIAASPALSLPARFDSLVIRDNPTGRGIDNNAGQRPLEIERVRFTGIFSYALYSYNAPVTIRHSEFRGNGGPATTTDTLRLLFGSALIENTLFAGNHNNTRSAVSFSAPVTFRNVTIAHNVGSSAGSFNDANTQIFNSVFWGNRTTSGGIVGLSAGNGFNSLFAAFNNTVDQNLSTFLTFFSLKTNNVAFDPAFLAPVAATAANLPSTVGDYSLTAASLAIDRGVNDQAPTAATDLAGTPRRHALHVDPGAYEFQGDDGIYAITTQPTDRFVTSGNATFTLAASRVATFTWEKSSDGGASFTAIPGAVYSNVAAGVTNSFSVAVSAANHGHLFRARVQFTTGPLLLSEPAALTTLTVAAALTRPAGQGTPATYAATANFAPDFWQWQLSTDSGATFEDIPAATDANLAVAADPASAGNTYRARATYAVGPVLHTTAVAYASSDVATVPGPASSAANRSVNLGVTGGIQPSSLTDASLFVHADLMGRIPLSELGAPVFSGGTLTIPFITAQHGGERVQVTTTSALLRADGLGVRPRVWEFRMRVLSGPGLFETPVTVGAAGATAFALGDFNEAGWVDALVATSSGLQLYSNTAGVFTASGTSFGPSGATALAAAALTPTGALDAATITADGDVQLWTNDGSGGFTLAQTFADLDARALAFGDLDADGDLDLFVATAAGNAVFLNDGTGAFVSATVFDTAATHALALGDLDQDGDLDALVTGATATAVWLNNGSGAFTAASTFAIGFDRVALADLDADGRLDAVLVAANTPATLLRNLGSAAFETLDALPGGGASATLATGDTDGDGRADLVLTDTSGRTGSWLTSAALVSTRYAAQPAFTLGAAAELADLNDDGSLDLFGLDLSGAPVVARYAFIRTTGAEDTTFQVNAISHTQSVYVVGLPAHGTLLINGQPIPNTLNYYGIYGTFSLGADSYRPAPNYNGADSFKWSNSLNGPWQTYWIHVTDVPDPVAPAPDSIAVLENATATTLVGGSPSVLANDTNNDAGTLAATLLTPPVHGTLTLNADGTFAYVHDGSADATDSFVYRATNLATEDSAIATVSIAITRLNDAPANLAFTAGDATYYTGRVPGATVGTLSATDTDPEDAGLLAFSLVGGAGSDHNTDFVIDGSSLNTAATINAAAGLTRSVRIRVTDTLGFFSERSFTVAFTQAPTAAPATFSTDEDVPVLLTLPGSGGATTLAYQIVTPPAHGSLTRPDADDEDFDVNLFTYVPDADFHGTDTLVYRVLDSALGSADATVTIHVAPVDDTPTLAAVAPITIDEDASATFTLVGADVEGSSLTYQLASTPALGSVQITGASVTYTPTANAHGVETLTFTATDGVHTSAPLQVEITVTSLDDLPVIAAIAPRTIQRNRTDTFAAVVTDVETASPTLRVGTAPAHGSVVLTGYSVAYTPDTGYTGSDTYTLIANDGALDSAPATVSVTVAPIPTEQVASIVYRGLYELTDLPAYGEGNWSGVLPTDISTPAHGSVSLSGARVRYQHNGDSATSDTFTYQLVNAADDIRTVTVSLTIRDRVLDVTDGSFIGTTGTMVIALNLTNRFADDTLAPAHTVRADWLVRIQPAAGEASEVLSAFYEQATFYSLFRIRSNVTIDASATPGHVLRSHFPGLTRHFMVMPGASLTLKHLDLAEGRTLPDLHYPVSRGGSVLNYGTFIAEDVVFSGNSADWGAAIFNDGGSVSLVDCLFDQNFITGESAPGGIVVSRNGSLSLDGVTFTANDGEAGGDLHVFGDGALATVNVTDSTIPSHQLTTLNGGTLSVTGLLYAADDSVTRSHGQPLALTVASLLANDVGGPFASVAIDTASALGGTLVRTGDDLLYTAPGGVTTPDTFTYTVTTSGGATSTATVTITVAANPFPTGHADAATVYRGISALLDVLANDTDENGGALTISAVTTPAHGTAVRNAENTRITYTHNGDSATSDTFTYSVSNGTHTTANITVNLTISDRVVVATSGANSGPGTLRAALDFVAGYGNSSPQWTIRIVAGSGATWTPTSTVFNNGLSAFVISGNVLIDATDSPNFTLSGPPNFPYGRLFMVPLGASLGLKNLTLAGCQAWENGSVTVGGAVFNQGVFTATGVTFRNNRASRGAALYNDGGTVSLTDCVITGNVSTPNFSTSVVGIVVSQGGSLTLAGNTLANEGFPNSAPALLMWGGTLTYAGLNQIASYQSIGSVTLVGVPAPANDTVQRPVGKAFKIPLATLYANDTGLTGTTVTFGTSAKGFALVRSGAFVLYQAPASFYQKPYWQDSHDSFTYTLTGANGMSATATVSIEAVEAPESATIAPTLSIEARGDGGLIIRVVGIPGRPYTIERSYELGYYAYWETVDSFTAPANGLRIYEDGPIPPWDPMMGGPPITSRFYRVRYNQ